MGVTTKERVPAVDGWFTTEEPYTLIGAKCVECGTYVFPPRSGACPNPSCASTELPPAPYVAAEPFEPYALAAVELETEGIVILGQVARGVMGADLEIGMEVEVDLQVLFTDADGVEKWVWTWAPAAPKGDTK